MLGFVPSVITFAVLTLLAAVAHANDRVTSIPGLKDKVCWNQFSGYLNATADHQLFYWYHEATTQAATKPLVLWLNGGPGCSSLGGMFTELGPFVLNENLEVTLNPYSFNKAANIIFIEQPAGVGFSYPNVPANDSSTAIDTDLALRHFLSQHPELQGRDFYVMGESYGGHYVPNTAKQIQISNSRTNNTKDIINLKGFAVGNGYTDWQLDFNANVENGRYHALTSSLLFTQANEACDGNFARCFWPRNDVVCPARCNDALQRAVTDAMDGSIDIYDIYEDVCLDPNQERLPTQMSTLLDHRRVALQQHLERSSDGERDLRATISPVFPTCIDNYSAKYLNLPSVQQAMHVRPGTVPNGKWSDCGNVKYDFNYETELSNYLEWTSTTGTNLEILIYNGDADFILSHMGNSAWINEGLHLAKQQEWTKWRGSDGQVAGYFEKYNTSGVNPLSFLTIKGAGHMVPRDRPRHALDFFSKFLNGGDYAQVKKTPEAPLCSGV